MILLANALKCFVVFSIALSSAIVCLSDIMAEETNQNVPEVCLRPFEPMLRANRALRGFMTQGPRRLPGPEGHYRSSFWCQILPKTFLSPDPKAVEANRWDLGDCTGRAILAWSALREMTGDRETGAEVEQGQKNFLLSILHPKCGLVYVPDLSDKRTGKYIYHIWDQSRTARGLVRWYETVPQDREKLKPYIERFWNGIDCNATIRGTDEIWGPYAGWPSDSFTSDRPDQPYFGHFVNNRVGICVEPLVDYFRLTSEQKYLDMATNFTNCEFSGHQGDHGKDEHKKYFAFNPDGSFDGHMHTKLGFFIGVVKLSRCLAEMGREEEAKRYLRQVHSCYQWIFNANNPSPSSKTGWIVESPRRLTGETCCTADMIELAGEMAHCAKIAPEFHDWVNLYDDVESMLVNRIAQMQVLFSKPLDKFLLAHYENDGKTQLKWARRLDGAWSGMVFPNDRITDGQKMPMPGCCQYAGVRALYSGWRNAMEYSDGILSVNFLLNRDSPQAIMKCHMPITGEGEIILKQNSVVRIRVPSWLDVEQMNINIDGQCYYAAEHLDNTGHFVSLGKLNQKSRIRINYPLEERMTKEILAGVGYAIRWRGNYVVAMNPPGKVLPVFPKN